MFAEGNRKSVNEFVLVEIIGDIAYLMASTLKLVYKTHWKPQEIGCLSSKEQLKGFQFVILLLEMYLFCFQDGAGVIRLRRSRKKI